MRFLTKCVSVLTVLVGVSLTNFDAAAKGAGVRSQSFDTDPGWTSLNTTINDNDYGFRESSFAGGTAGEAGGIFTRTEPTTFYADSDLNGTLSLDDALATSGRFDVTFCEVRRQNHPVALQRR